MKSGIGKPRQRREFSIFNFQFSIIILCLFSLALFLPTRIFAVSTIDFSSFKDYFKEIKVGDKISGDLESGAIPNPYEAKGNLVGYKISLPKDVDPTLVNLKLESCAFHFAFICVGKSFGENIYVYDKNFQPIGEKFKFSQSVELGKIRVPEDKTLYLLIGSDDASGTGQYVFSVNLASSSK